MIFVPLLLNITVKVSVSNQPLTGQNTCQSDRPRGWGLFPLDGAGGFGGDIVNYAVHTVYFGHYAL